jgi:hypothetical protein
METEKNNNQRTKLSIYILDTLESESTTRFKNRSSDRMMTSDWLVDVSDDRYTTNTDTIYIVTYILLNWIQMYNMYKFIFLGFIFVFNVTFSYQVLN